MALADKLVVNDFLKRTLPIFRPNDIQKFSNGLTSLESAFNVISTGLVNVNNIQKAHARSQRLNAREIVAETKQITTAGVIQEPTTLSSIGPLQTLLESIKKLNAALERLDLTPKNVAGGSTPMGGGDASPDIDIDIDVGKKRKRGFSLPRIGRIGRSFTSTIGRTLSLGVSRALRTSGGGAQTAVSSDVTKTLLGIAAGTAGLSAIFGGGGGTFGGGGGSFGGAGASGSWDGTAVEFDGDINKILATIRTLESGGDYSTPKPKGMAGTASGAYSFIDETWKSLTKKYRTGAQYPKAYLAPPAIQDAVAGLYVQEILKKYGELQRSIISRSSSSQ